MNTITVDNVNALEVEPHVFVTEASDLGILAGMPIPVTLATSLGNRQPLVYCSRDEHGTLLYRQSLGCIQVRVFND